MITEDYVSFETAKLLKEKGFKNNNDMLLGKSGRHYNKYEQFPSKEQAIEASIDCEDKCPLVTIQMAMKWLRKIKECPIEILWHWDSDNQCEKWYFRHHLELREQPQIEYFDEPEQAAEAAIRYCLEHLI